MTIRGLFPPANYPCYLPIGIITASFTHRKLLAVDRTAFSSIQANASSDRTQQGALKGGLPTGCELRSLGQPCPFAVYSLDFTKMRQVFIALVAVSSLLALGSAEAQIADAQLAKWLKRFPQADMNKDGKLSIAEAEAFRKKMQRGGGGAPRTFTVDPGWKKDRFPDHAVCYKTPKEIEALYAKQTRGREPVVSYEKPTDGSLRIVGTGHSFMAPGYKTFPAITKAAGLKQPPLVTHTGGGMTGSTRYKWEQENGIFQFDRKPTPKLLASIANAKWDAMMWGPYYNDRPEYYSCWIDFCLKYNPDMKFYASDAWPQLDQLDHMPASEDELTDELFVRLGKEKFDTYSSIVNELNSKYDDRVFVMPTCEALVLCTQYFHAGKLPGIEGLHKAVGKKERSLWRDKLGHLGPGLERLEGYVFYATIYGRNPELIETNAFGKASFPSSELDRTFREIAWKAVLNNPLSGVVDENQNGVADDRELAAAR